MKRICYTVVFVIILLCLDSSIPAQVRTNQEEAITRLEQKVQLLERQLGDVQKLYDEHKKLLLGEAGNKSTELENKFNRLSIELEEQHRILRLLGWIFGPLILITLLLSYFKLKKYIEKRATEKIEAKLDQFVSNRKKELKAIAEEYAEKIAVEKKKILVYSSDMTQSLNLTRFLNNRGFKNVVPAIPGMSNEREDMDLILFNEETGKLDAGLIKDLANLTPDTVLCFYYGAHYDKKGLNHNVLQRFNAANSRVQLYGNLINSLRYQGTL